MSHHHFLIPGAVSFEDYWVGSALKGDTGPSALAPAPREDHIHGSALAEGCGALSLPP